MLIDVGIDLARPVRQPQTRHTLIDMCAVRGTEPPALLKVCLDIVLGKGRWFDGPYRNTSWDTRAAVAGNKEDHNACRAWSFLRSPEQFDQDRLDERTIGLQVDDRNQATTFGGDERTERI